MKGGAPFASEADLCRDLAEAAARQGWTVYPETADFDLLLLRDGVQVGVEAKLRASIELLSQVARHVNVRAHGFRGPHYVAAAVPAFRMEAAEVFRALGVALLYPQGSGRGGQRWPDIEAAVDPFPPLHFEEPAWLPPVVPTCAAGVPCPVRLTSWKWHALRLLARLELRGFVTVQDFRSIGLHPSRWYHFWLLPEGNDRPQRWVRKPGETLADAQHPAEFLEAVIQEREILAREECAARPSKAAGQPSLFSGATA